MLPEHQIREPAVARSLGGGEIDWSRIDTVVVSTFEDDELHRSVRDLPKLELVEIRALAERALHRHRDSHPEPLAPLELHGHLSRGLSGESLLVSSSMFLDTLREAEAFFHHSFKTIKSRLGGTLDTGTSELALRAVRVTLAAAEILGSFDAARRYMRTRNFALGGATALELLKTAEGERLVMNELHAMSESGPL